VGPCRSPAVSDRYHNRIKLIGALETNEENADHSGMIELYQQLASAAPEQLPAVVEQYTDVDSWLSFLTVDRAIKNWDGPTSFYCRGRGTCRNHNYYLYQHEARPYLCAQPARSVAGLPEALSGVQ
jgi:spore coat protein CotH